MCNVSSFFKYILFADDTTILRAGNDIKLINKEVNHELIALSQWFSINKLSINLEKTQCMLFTKSKSFRNITITLNNVGIKQIHSARFLGVYIDYKLTWRDHISYISNKLAKSISILHPVKWTLNSQTLRLVYYTLVLPYISYCAIIFGNTYYTNVLPIFTKQKKAIRIISNAKYNDHTSKLFCNLNILTIFQLVKLQTCIMMYKAFSNKLPENIQSYFTKSFSGNEYRTRQKNCLKKKYTQTTKRQYCLSNIGAKVWNSLNENIKSCDN